MIFKMLENDFQRLNKNTVSKLVAADLRFECYSLYKKKQRNEWEENRLNELLQTPACQEEYFVKLLNKGK